VAGRFAGAGHREAGRWAAHLDDLVAALRRGKMLDSRVVPRLEVVRAAGLVAHPFGALGRVADPASLEDPVEVALVGSYPGIVQAGGSSLAEGHALAVRLDTLADVVRVRAAGRGVAVRWDASHRSTAGWDTSVGLVALARLDASEDPNLKKQN
jgi:hypothetical protein